MKILNFAKTNNIKSHLTLSNWDTLTTKSPILTMPDTIGLFGKSSQKHFKMLKYLDDHCRVILEGPNYLKFLYKNVNKKQKYLKKNVVIFAESIRSKYTLNLLLLIENLVEKNFKSKIKILFKPHPLRKLNSNEINFYNQKFKNIFIPNKLKKNYLISLKRQLNDKDLNPSYLDSSLYLKNSIGVISQPSTFLLDSAINNIIPFLI